MLNLAPFKQAYVYFLGAVSGELKQGLSFDESLKSHVDLNSWIDETFACFAMVILDGINQYSRIKSNPSRLGISVKGSQPAATLCCTYAHNVKS